MLALLVQTALAGPIFLTVGDEMSLGTSGNWPRAFPTTDGWHLLHANQGDYAYAFLRDDFTHDPSKDRNLTGSTVLRDHAVAECPDGTFFHVATANLDRDNDTAYTFTYDADFNLLDSGVIVERSPTGSLADVPAVCGDNFRGAAWWVPEENLPIRYAAIADDLSVTGTFDFALTMPAIGSSMMDEGDGILRVFSAPGKEANTLGITEIESDLTTMTRFDLDVMPDGWAPYWAQGNLQVGDCTLVVHMAEDTAYEWKTQGGDVWLEAFDPDWNLLDQVQLSHNVAPVGGMQPGVSRKGDTLLVTYAKSLQNYGFAVTMDLDACGYVKEPDDTGTVDTGTPPDTGSGDSGGKDTSADSGGEDTSADSGGDSSVDSGDSEGPHDTAIGPTADKGGCGCSTGTGDGTVGGALAGLIVGSALLRRRA